MLNDDESDEEEDDDEDDEDESSEEDEETPKKVPVSIISFVDFSYWSILDIGPSKFLIFLQ